MAYLEYPPSSSTGHAQGSNDPDPYKQGWTVAISPSNLRVVNILFQDVRRL